MSTVDAKEQAPDDQAEVKLGRAVYSALESEMSILSKEGYKDVKLMLFPTRSTTTQGLMQLLTLALYMNRTGRTTKVMG